MQFPLDESAPGTRLDVFVAAALPRVSRAYIQKLCDNGRILVNNETVKPGYKIKAGDTITSDYDPKELDEIPVIDIPVLYEDNDCVVMHKPAGLLTHAQGHLSTEPTVASFLRTKIQSSDDWKEAGRAGIVHRLDRATSGVIIGAKNQAALSFLQKQFATRKTKKTYLAIVEGHPKNSEAVIDMPIERNPKAPATFRVGPNGKPSQTHYQVLSTHGEYSLLELKPTTGRTHQLRVHLAAIEHPIVGDPLYGHGQFGDRLYLHAASLELTLPNRERKIFTAPQPAEFDTILAQS